MRDGNVRDRTLREKQQQDYVLGNEPPKGGRFPKYSPPTHGNFTKGLLWLLLEDHGSRETIPLVGMGCFRGESNNEPPEVSH